MSQVLCDIMDIQALLLPSWRLQSNGGKCQLIIARDVKSVAKEEVSERQGDRFSLGRG